MRRISLCSSVAALAAFLTAASVQAQPPADSTSPPPANANTASATFHSASSSRGQGLGVGAITMLNGASGVLGTWGTGGFHVDGFLGLHHYKPGGNNTSSTTDVAFGARGWYHLHAASFADFSLGGGIGFTRWVQNPGAANEDSHLDVSVEVGGQIRAFIVPNVALMGDMGFGMTFGRNDDILFGAQSWGGGGRGFVQGSLGIAYFFE